MPIPAGVDSLHVTAIGDRQTGDGCTGTAAAPVAAPGYVCIYVSSENNATKSYGVSGRGNLSGSQNASGDDSTLGFGVVLQGTNGFYANGTWAYTAP